MRPGSMSAWGPAATKIQSFRSVPGCTPASSPGRSEALGADHGLERRMHAAVVREPLHVDERLCVAEAGGDRGVHQPPDPRAGE